MNRIDRHISFLMGRHDCVIVPGLGAFVAQYVPARMDREKGIVIPPSRSVGFNQSLSHNDGLLASSIARATGVTFEAAMNEITSQVSSLKYQLKIYGETSIGHIGSLVQVGKSPMYFQPNTTPVTAPQYYGLQPAKITTISSILQEEKKHIEHETKKLRKLPRFIRYASRVAASIVLLIGLGILLSTPIIVDQKHPAMASMSSITTVSAPKTLTIPSVNVDSAKQTITTNRIVPEDSTSETNNDNLLRNDATISTFRMAPQDVRITPRATLFKENETSLRINDEDPYCLIIASLATREDADRYISENSDKTLHCLEQNGRFRIYIATGSTIAQVSAPLKSSDFMDKYPGAWVCKR